MADKQIFNVILEKHETINATGITIPFDVKKVFGAKRVPVKVTINGAEHRSTVVRMGERYMIVEAKKEDTRTRRIEKAIELISSKKIKK